MALLTSLKDLDHPTQIFKIGQKITEEGSPGKKVYILKKGIVAVSINKKVIATALDPGSIFGEIASVCGCNHSATVTAVEESEFFVIDDFITYLHQHPEDSLSVIKSLCERIVLLNDNEVSRTITL